MYATISMFLFFSPVFDGIYDFCSMYTGATMEGCVKLNNRVSFPIVSILNLNAYILSCQFSQYSLQDYWDEKVFFKLFLNSGF